ncbi:DUF1048 domain-containing protein [Nocardia sp. CDC159]|uniref:DUF1048 domain-containing protein n=1 Tax=Nocardia pulmonis TaxID=2951408 RepID=A0A9X2IZ54_9NOCA|nr:MULTISPECIES: DUF1048 domain-containing protein [Nocardia]MCM6777143.1 DUF1048 domain-containing protein [Nocardia pulmonis]MCM6790028.1 DUF1048 domain-containing protein [Nocardia sp. CDC159]
MFISKVIGDLGEKRRWRLYQARVKQLAEPYRTAVDAFQQYLMSSGAGSDVSMFEDLAELFEQGAADRTPLRDIVGTDPVEFIETFARNYEGESWRNRQRERLIEAIERASGADTGS